VLGALILVNNAGVYPWVKLLEMRGSDWDYVLDINLKAVVATIAFVKATGSTPARDQHSPQAILQIACVVCTTARARRCGFDDSCEVLELAPQNIRVARHRTRHDRLRSRATATPRQNCRDGRDHSTRRQVCLLIDCTNGSVPAPRMPMRSPARSRTCGGTPCREIVDSPL
jgi:hypothetical protein